MLHRNRVWGVVEATQHPTLAAMLTDHTWTLCTGFRLGNYLLLNDSTSADAAQEYAVVRSDTGEQLESLTVSWMKFPQMLAHINCIVRGEYDHLGLGLGAIDVASQVQPADQHGRCPACA